MSLFTYLWSLTSFRRDSRSLGSSQATKGRSQDGAIHKNGTLPNDPVETVVAACSYAFLAFVFEHHLETIPILHFAKVALRQIQPGLYVTRSERTEGIWESFSILELMDV